MGVGPGEVEGEDLLAGVVHFQDQVVLADVLEQTLDGRHEHVRLARAPQVVHQVAVDAGAAEHLLLGLLREEKGIAAQVLTDAGVNLDAAFFCSRAVALFSSVLAYIFWNRGVEEVDPIERASLRIATYELRHRPDVPYRVVINEAVELGKAFGTEASSAFVNGLLDAIAKAARPA